MAKTLILFLFSDRVDAYINAIAYTYERMQVDSVKLVYVRDTPTGLTDEKASEVFTSIWNRIQSLASKSEDDKSFKIYREINTRLLKRGLTPINYAMLKRDLSKLIKEHGGSRNCIIDLTGASKVPSIDVFSVCLALGVRSVYTFELAIRPSSNNPENFLYHSLDEDKFSYTCLSETKPVKASQAALLRKELLLRYISIVSFIIMTLSLYILVTMGPDNIVVQGLNLISAIVGLSSSLFTFIIALFKQ